MVLPGGESGGKERDSEPTKGQAKGLDSQVLLLRDSETLKGKLKRIKGIWTLV